MGILPLPSNYWPNLSSTHIKRKPSKTNFSTSIVDMLKPLDRGRSFKITLSWTFSTSDISRRSAPCHQTGSSFKRRSPAPCIGLRERSSNRTGDSKYQSVKSRKSSTTIKTPIPSLFSRCSMPLSRLICRTLLIFVLQWGHGPSSLSNSPSTKPTSNP